MLPLKVFIMLCVLGTSIARAQEAKRCDPGCEGRGVRIQEASVEVSEDGVPCGTWTFEIGGISIDSGDACPSLIVYSPECGIAVEKPGYCIALHRYESILAYSPECFRLWIPAFEVRLSVCILGKPDVIGSADCSEEAVCSESFEER